MRITIDGKTYEGTRLEIKEDRHIYLDKVDMGELDDTRFTGFMREGVLVMNQPQKYLSVVK
jgi:hypothetical protein